MKIFTPIAASLVLVCATVQGELIAQKDNESDLRQHIRRIVREELKRALAEVHDAQDRAAATAKKAIAARKAPAVRKAPAARKAVKKAPPGPRARPTPMAPPVGDALDRARKALAEARRALAEAERALQRAHGEAPWIHAPKVELRGFQAPWVELRELQAPRANLQVMRPEVRFRTWILDGKKGTHGITYEVEEAPVKANKKKGPKEDQQQRRREEKQKEKRRRKARDRDKARSGRIV